MSGKCHQGGPVASGILVLALAISGPSSAQVRREWAVTYNGPDNHSDHARAIVTDEEANVYVSGTAHSPTIAASEYATLKYDAQGGFLWERRVGVSSETLPPALALDRESNLYLAASTWNGSPQEGGTSMDYLLVKYSPGGDLLWSRTYDFPAASGIDEAHALALDSAGNAYITGASWGGRSEDGGTGYDFATLKYDPAGNRLWERRYDTGGVEGDRAVAIQVDPAGTVYVLGWDHFRTYILLKYDAEGNFTWERRQTGPIGTVIDPPLLALDLEGHVLVAGTPETECGVHHIGVWKYDGEGQLQWARTYPEEPCIAMPARAMAVDGQASVVVTGGRFTCDYETIQYDRDGNLEWTRSHDGPAFVDGFGTRRSPCDVPQAMAIDAAGDIWICGRSEIQAVTMRYDAQGLLWLAAAYDGDPHRLASPAALAVSPDGGVCLAGLALNSESGNTDYAVWKYVPTDTVHFTRGDATADGRFDISDPVHSLLWLFTMGDAPPCIQTADTNADGVVDIADATFSLGHLFLGTAEPPPPFASCGPSATDQALSCRRYPPCWSEL